MKERLYHGSKKQGLVQLKPAESGHEAKFVYAVSCEAFAAIFINRTGGSLVASWGRLKDNTPYFCELKKGIFEKNYSGRAGSIYAVNREYFSQNNQLWKEEWISENVVPVIKEIKIPNIKEYLLNLEQEKN